MPTLNVKRSDGTLEPIVGDAYGGGLVLLYDHVVSDIYEDFLDINLREFTEPPTGFVFNKYVFEVGGSKFYNLLMRIDGNEEGLYVWHRIGAPGETDTDTGSFRMANVEEMSTTGGNYKSFVRGTIFRPSEEPNIACNTVLCNWESCIPIRITSAVTNPRHDAGWGSYWSEIFDSPQDPLHMISITCNNNIIPEDTCIKIWGVLSTAAVPS
jgi:hypothetical protein